jgi:HAD superfamily hydrolase (TIGR01459 family)
MSKPQPELVAGLGGLASDYDVLLCDIWGVIHDGVERFSGACEALERFAQERGPVVLVSNSPRPSRDLLPQLAALGVPKSAYSNVVTSGDVTRALLDERAPAAVWAIGPDRDQGLYQGLDLTFCGPASADFISCTGPFDDEVETPEDYRQALQSAAARGLVMICANPDLVVQRGGRLIYCGGALAALYQELGGKAVMAGKPFAPIYAEALAMAERSLAGALRRDRVLAVGDGVRTDVKGAAAEGFDCLFVANGIHAAEASDGAGRLDPAALSRTFAKEGVHARYALAALVW